MIPVETQQKLHDIITSKTVSVYQEQPWKLGFTAESLSSMSKQEIKDCLEDLVFQAMREYYNFIEHNIDTTGGETHSNAMYNVTGDDLWARLMISDDLLKDL